MDYLSKISFPGLGIGEFSVHNVAFKIFNYPVMWYGVIISFGLVCGFLYFSYRAGKAGIKFDDVMDITLITVPAAVIAARLYFVIFYGGVDSFADLIAIRNGGLAIYGAIIGGAISVICVTAYKKINFFKFADMIIPGVMVGQLIGRWGNFCNGEAFGGLVSESSPLYFIRMGLQNGNTWEKFSTTDMVFVHPTFLYESVWNLIGFILINVFYKKKKYNGEVLLWYLAWYGFGRMLIEQLRTDSLYIGNSGIRVSALIGFICALITIPMIIVFRILRRKYTRGGMLSETAVISVPFFFGIGRAKTIAALTNDGTGFNTEEFERTEAEKDELSVRKAKSKKKLFEAETSDTAETEVPQKLVFKMKKEETAAEEPGTEKTEDEDNGENN